MKYYRVKAEHDNKKQGENNIYIANELYTETEVKRNNLNTDYMEVVNINKNNTCFSFGARVEANNKTHKFM